MAKYSICITHYNCKPSLERSLKSILDQTNSDFEIVIVDNKSTDGSAEILRNYSDQGKIKLIVRKCSRGFGRQIGLENATGDYVISGLDMDDTFKPRLNSFLRFYHDRAEEKLLGGFGEATMIAPRKLLTRLGGWRDLQFRENWELCRRAAGEDGYRWTIFPLVATINPHQERRDFRATIKYRYIRYRENLRVGHKQFDEREDTGLSQKLVWFAAKLSVFFLPRYTVGYNFTSVDPKYFVDAREYWPKDDNLGREKELYNMLFKENFDSSF